MNPMGGGQATRPYQGHKAQDNRAPGITETRKPLHGDKAVAQEGPVGGPREDPGQVGETVSPPKRARNVAGEREVWVYPELDPGLVMEDGLK